MILLSLSSVLSVSRLQNFVITSVSVIIAMLCLQSVPSLTSLQSLMALSSVLSEHSNMIVLSLPSVLLEQSFVCNQCRH